MSAGQPHPDEVAPGVYQVELGKRVTETNVYLVCSETGWVLVDTGWRRHAPAVIRAAESLSGRAVLRRRSC